jgi:hypothetical protein
MTCELLQFCRRGNIVIVPRHMPGKHNILVDALSRSNKLVSTEWTLHMDVVQALQNLWGSLTIDLFATKLFPLHSWLCYVETESTLGE